MDAGLDPEHVGNRQMQRDVPLPPPSMKAKPRPGKLHLPSGELRHRAVFESSADFAIVVSDAGEIVAGRYSGAEYVMGCRAAEIARPRHVPILHP